MINFTQQDLTDLFNGGKSYDDIANDFSNQSGQQITGKMVQDLFKDNGFNLRNRPRKQPVQPWYQINTDTTVDSTPVLTEQFA